MPCPPVATPPRTHPPPTIPRIQTFAKSDAPKPPQNQIPDGHGMAVPPQPHGQSARQFGCAKMFSSAHHALTLPTPSRILEFSTKRRKAQRPGATMPIPKTEKIWHNGKLINWDDATLHVLSHVVELRLGSLRRHPLLRNQARPGHLPPARTHAAPDQLRENLSHGAAFHRG